MFNHILLTTYCYSFPNRQGSFTYVRCKTRLDITTKFMVVVTSLFNLVISSFPDNLFYHVWTKLLIYHDGSNVVQVCSFIKPWIVCSNMHQQACQQQCSSWPAQPCSSMSTGKNKLCIFTSVLHEVIFYSSLCVYVGQLGLTCWFCNYSKTTVHN